MSASDPSFDRARETLDAFSSILYETPTDSDAADDSPIFDALSRIGERYERPERIGRGGMKEIFRVYDRRAARHVAMAKPAPGVGPDGFDAFLREAHLTARLDHPAIIKLFDMGIDRDGRPFFTMEFKKGRSLLEVLRDGESASFPQRKRLEVFLRVCEAVAWAHRHRVLHLDIKPDNIQVGDFGEVQLCDWGMGVVLAAPDGEMENSEVFLDPDLYGPLLTHFSGTPGYMAPEQHDPRTPKTPAMDIHALGRVLADLTRDTLPSVALKSIIETATHEDPARRYPDVGSMHEDVARHLAGFSAAAEHAGFIREARLFYRRNRVACGVTAALLLLMVAGTLTFIDRLQHSKAAAMQARDRAERAFLESERRLERQIQLALMLTNRISRLPVYNADKQLQIALAQARLLINEVVALDPPPDAPVWYQSFWLHFLTQNFDAALALRDKDLTEVADLVEIAARYAADRDDEGWLTDEAFAKVIVELTRTVAPHGMGRGPMVEYMLAYDHEAHPRPIDEKTAILTHLLGDIQKRETEVRLEIDEETRSLRVRGPGVEHLTTQEGYPYFAKSLLRFLNPLHLDLRGTAVENLRELNGLELLTLDLRDTPVRDFSPLSTMRSLRTVKISPDQPEPLGLPEWVELRRE